MARQKRRRRRPAWRGKRRGGDSLRERRPYKTRAELAPGKTVWFHKRDNKFFWSGDWRKLTLPARSVLEVLVHLADGSNPYRWLYASDADVMYYCDLSRRAVEHAFWDLQENGCVEGERGARRPGRYRLTDKVQAFAHGPRKDPRRPPLAAAAPTAPKPDAGDVATPSVDGEYLELPAEVAATITPKHWRRILKKHSARQIRGAVMAYCSQRSAHRINKPLALFHYLLQQDWTAARAAEIAEADASAAAADERAGQRREARRLEQERAAAWAQAHSRDFTPAELLEYSETALERVRAMTFISRPKKRVGSGIWKQEVWRLIDEAQDATEAPQDDPETTQSDSTPNGPDVAAEAPPTTRGG